MKKGLRRVAAVAVATLVVAPALATVASATSTFAFDRLAGIDRYATSVAVAGQYGASTNVILASGVPGHYPDALTASYLAGFKSAPIMLTLKDATPANVVARITASGATDVWLVGGTGVISAAQEAALDVKFGTVHRLGGLDRYLTAAAVIGAAGVATSTTHTAVLATGVNFPDAIAGGPLSYVKGMPLAITLADRLPAATLSSLKAAGVTNVIALGGPTIITPAVLAALAAQGITLNQRIYGANRSETSSLLAEYMVTSQGFSKAAVNVASGYAFGTGADALGGAPLSGKENRPTLITESVTTVGPGVIKYLTDHAPTLASGHIFGGLGAVSQASEDAMEAAARTAPAGPITLTSAGVAQGGTLTGAVANHSSVSNVAVVGCGITNTDVTISATGTFSLLVPASQAPGACNLVFTITNTDGTTSTQTVAVTVTAVAKGVTAAPDLVSVAITAGTNNVVYTFDSPLANIDMGLNPSSFHVYGANGTEYNPLQITSSGSTVTARFASLALTTTATVDRGAVADANLRPNPVNALPLQSITLAIGKTSAPDLVSVGNPGVVLGNTTFDFTFDAPIVTPVADPGAFFVITTDGEMFQGFGTPTYNAAKTVATVAVNSLMATPLPSSQVVRGGIFTHAVADTAGRFNPQETAKVTTGATTAPDLLSVAVIGTNTVRYIFDQPVQGQNPTGFVVYNSTGTAGMEANGTGVAPVNGNAAAVDVTFLAGKVADAVGTSIGCDMGGCAVQGTNGTTQGNAVDSMGLQSITYVAGRTALPDLVSVAKSIDAFNVTRVSYTFDDAVPVTALGAGLFSMYDPAGAQFLSAVAGTLSNGNMTVTVTGGFTPAQLAAATIGGVDANPGSDAVGATPAFPEGAANIG